MDLWNRDVFFLVALVVLGALLVVVYLWVWMTTLRAPGVPKLLRYFTWLPPLAPVVAFRAGSRVISVLWFIVLIAYLVLRSLA